MIINRLKHNNTQNAGYTIIAAVEGKGQINGHPEFWVTMERTRYVSGNNTIMGKWVTEYVTWSGGWNPAEKSEYCTEWSLLYSQGHTEFYGENARKDAIKDMMVRAGILPEPLAEWEKELLNQAKEVKPGTYDVSSQGVDVHTYLHVQDAYTASLSYKDTSDKEHVVFLFGDEQDTLRRALNGELTPLDPATAPEVPHI